MSLLESFVTFLIEHNLLENSQDGSETLSKFLTLYEQFEEQQDADNQQQDDSSQQEDSQLLFETRAIFTLADFLKALTANEYYDIAQRLYNQWQEGESKKYIKQIEKVVRIREKLDYSMKQDAINKWKYIKEFAFLIEENEKLREYIHLLTREKENLSQERNILELQTKKRNQISLTNINPLRQSRKTSLTQRTSSNSRSQNFTQTLKGELFSDNSESIHERLHREAYQKNQQLVLNDFIKQKDELKDCTFKPNLSMLPLSQNNATPLALSNSLPQRREDPFLFERLSKSTRKFNPELMQLQKENEELKDCTFKPETNIRSQQLAEKVQNDYMDKDQFYERLYKEAENKDKFKKSLQLLKDKAEINSCTFQPELISNRNQSIMSSSRKGARSDSNNKDPFSRLHQEHELKQRSLVKKESEYDQKFRESHPFQPIRVTKQLDKKLTSNRKETSQQRAARMYDEWKEKERKIEEKRKELKKEEEKLCKLTLISQQNRRPLNEAKRNSIDSNQNHSISTQNQDISLTCSIQQAPFDRLYTQGRDKNRKQEELRDKIYREQGFSFAPHTNINYKVEKNIIDRNKEFIQKKENHINEIKQQTSYDFKPQRVTTKSKLAQPYERSIDDNQENLSQKLYQKGAEIEQRKEKQRQEFSIDKNCTFKPQLARKTDRILRESSAQRNGSTYTRSTASLTSIQVENSSKHAFTGRMNN